MWDRREPDVDPADLRGEEDEGINGEEWCAKTPGDAWPDSLTPESVTRETLNELMATHYQAAGGKSREPTFDLLHLVCEADGLASVPAAEYRRLAKALLKDTARYRYGLKKPVGANGK
jgi:hypothetical protein